MALSVYKPKRRGIPSDPRYDEYEQALQAPVENMGPPMLPRDNYGPPLPRGFEPEQIATLPAASVSGQDFAPAQQVTQQLTGVAPQQDAGFEQILERLSGVAPPEAGPGAPQLELARMDGSKRSAPQFDKRRRNIMAILTGVGAIGQIATGGEGTLGAISGGLAIGGSNTLRDQTERHRAQQDAYQEYLDEVQGKNLDIDNTQRIEQYKSDSKRYDQTLEDLEAGRVRKIERGYEVEDQDTERQDTIDTENRENVEYARRMEVEMTHALDKMEREGIIDRNTRVQLEQIQAASRQAVEASRAGSAAEIANIRGDHTVEAAQVRADAPGATRATPQYVETAPQKASILHVLNDRIADITRQLGETREDGKPVIVPGREQHQFLMELRADLQRQHDTTYGQLDRATARAYDEQVAADTRDQALRASSTVQQYVQAFGSPEMRQHPQVLMNTLRQLVQPPNPRLTNAEANAILDELGYPQ